MPRLTNDKQELYCHHRANGMAPAKAATAAGYISGSASYSDLEKRPDIIARIEEKIEENRARREAHRHAAREAGRMVAEATGASKSWVISQLAENAKNAASEGDYKASNDALKLIGEEFGMFQGQSGGEPDENGEMAIDMDIIDALAPPGQPAAVEVTVLEDEELPEAAARLLAGSPSRAPNRKLTPETEANEAFIDDPREFVFDEEDEDDIDTEEKD